jgi:hypothetical protein
MENPDEIPDYDELFITEKFWRNNFAYLKDRGYLLRPRFSPDWVPSWKTRGGDPSKAEDAAVFPVSRILCLCIVFTPATADLCARHII